MTSEVLIVGGGVIGLSIARELHKRGVSRITLVEKGVCGEESSWAAGGMLGPQAEADERGPFFDICSASRDLYPVFAAELLDETGVDIELDRTGTLYLAFTDEDVAEVHERFRWQRKAGFDVEYWSADKAREAEPYISPDVRGALFFPNDWQVENRKLLAALRRYAELNGINILENTPVENLIVENGRVTGAKTATDRIDAGQTILATGAWTSLIKVGVTEMPFSIEPVRGQMIVFQTAEPLFRHVIYSPRGYVVPRLNGRLLAGSTSENVGFEKVVTDSAASKLRAMAGEIAPATVRLEIFDHWSGLRPCAPDGMPVLGPINGVEGLIVATAHYRNGILLAPWTANLSADMLLDDRSMPYSDLFGPDRFRPRSESTAI